MSAPSKSFDEKAEAARVAKAYAASFRPYMDQDGKVIWSFLFTMPDDPKASGTATMPRKSAGGHIIHPGPPKIEKLVRMEPDIKKATEWGFKYQKEIRATSFAVALYAMEKTP